MQMEAKPAPTFYTDGHVELTCVAYVYACRYVWRFVSLVCACVSVRIYTHSALNYISSPGITVFI